MIDQQEREPQPKLDFLILLLVGVASLFLFWFFRTNGWTGGDSEQWEREVTGGLWFRRRQMISFASMQLTYQVMNGLFHWSGMMAISLISALSGACGAMIVWLMLREQPRRWYLLAIVLTSGWTAVWYGHIETYAQPAAALLLHLLAMQRFMEGRWPVWTVTLSWVFFLACHLVAAFSFPALCWVLWSQRNNHQSTTYWNQAAWGFAPTVILVPIIVFYKKIVGELIDPYTAGHWWQMVTQPWTLWEAIKVPLKLHFAWWNGGLMAIAALILAFLTLRKSLQTYPAQLAVYFLCFLVYTIIWDPHRGETDWDLYTFPWIVGSILVARLVTELPYWKVATTAILLVNGWLLVTRPITWSSFWDRGTGSVLVNDQTADRGNHLFLLNDRTIIDDALYYVPKGEHFIRVIQIRSGANKKFPIVIDRDEMLTVLVEEDGISLLEEDGDYQ